MKCPKCKKDLIECKIGGNVNYYCYLICVNKKCCFYGIRRLDLDKERE